ncbi:MAG TPA: hypothetical protein PKE12_02445 [Kiritimatiellia bacterium]|nr:hypothetical protein [Kiritimatiellia bacterium]
MISPPPELFETIRPEPDHIRWHLRAREKEEIESLMASCGLDPALRARWVLGAARGAEADLWVVRPALEDVIAIPADTRECWYDLLMLWPQNINQRQPFRFAVRPGVEWVNFDGFPSESRAALSNLFYRHEDVVKFADMDVIPALLRDPNDVARFKRMIASKRTLLAALFVNPGDDIEALTEYWGVFGRRERIRPIIELASRSRSPWGVPLELLFPPIPRSHIYTYQQGASAPFELDCNWSTYNFFRAEPDYSVNSAPLRRDFLLDHYDTIDAPTQFGDIVAFLDRRYRVLHLCNFIADNLVFTKNGFSVLQPWILMRLDDVEAYFQSEFQVIQKAYFRYRGNP